MKKRAHVNIALILTIIILAVFSLSSPALAGSRTFLTSWGTMAGYTITDAASSRAKSTSNAGVLYWIHVHMNGWGACSPDMSCSWIIKDNKPANSYFSSSTTEVTFSNLWTAISRHRFQKFTGGTIATGYTSGDQNNAYGSFNCWSAFTSSCNR